MLQRTVHEWINVICALIFLISSNRTTKLQRSVIEFSISNTVTVLGGGNSFQHNGA